ncbi:hypothetical protein NW768_005866 [Fusarium equiseti]|uniref:DNA2/NAM7 helicase-like C-terminal domain-containing protein n=1 Tax=Fusarium equiseti TaxID=61235 RepID=A0ABQ8RD58_FUSEQ|nr:hypothetical protein NW768_005866 [Fusarium equiseti]
MSQPTSSDSKGNAPNAPRAASQDKPSGPTTVFKSCAVLIYEQLFGGQNLGVSDIETKLITLRRATLERYLGHFIDFPLAASNEDEGFGKCHTTRQSYTSFKGLKVKFPCKVEVIFRAVTQKEISRLPKGRTNISWVKVALKEGAELSVKGFRLPFGNTSHPAHEWLRHPDSAPVVSDKTLLDILQQKKLTFIVAEPHRALEKNMGVTSLPANFEYDYGGMHSWDMERYLQQLSEIKGGQFEASWSYPSDESHVVSVTQTYFVPKPTTLKQSMRYFVIVSMGKGFSAQFEKAWSRLSKDFPLTVMIHGGDYNEEWKAHIQEYSERLDALNDHPFTAKQDELALKVIPPKAYQAEIKEFEGRKKADEAEIERKVDAVCQFLPTAAPTSVARGESLEDSKPGLDYEKLVMSLHRDLTRGAGFWETTVSLTSGTEQLEGDLAQMGLTQAKLMRLETLPSVNLLRGPNEQWIDALMTEALEVDRARFRRYLGECPLGLGLITAGPGFGKTTAVAFATLGMAASVGRVIGSGPTHVAVNSLCARIGFVTCRVTESTTLLHDKVAAFKKLLESPVVGEDAPLEMLKGLHKTLTERSDIARLRNRVSGKNTWEEYVNGDTVDEAELEKLIQHITVLHSWKLKTRGIAIDEAGNMTRADLFSVWGNTLLPCLLAGDEKQLALVVMTLIDKEDGNYANRFGPDGVTSPLEFIKGMGWPIYRLRTQLRLARGQFELCCNSVYKDVACTYGPGTDVKPPAHRLGHVLEEFVRAKFPSVKPPKPDGQNDTLSPLFVNCRNSFCHIGPVTHSRTNWDQIKFALDFLDDFVKTKQVNPANILIISPYSAMVAAIGNVYKRREYEVLEEMRPPSTVDAIQDQEADMVVVITATDCSVGADFTSDERRLNVLLSRHKCALIIFSDIDTVDYKGKGKHKAERIRTPTGEVSFQKARVLKDVHKSLVDAGRVVAVDCRPNKRKGEDETAK